MILAAVKDPFLLHSVRRTAQPAEDVFCGVEDVSVALEGRLHVLTRISAEVLTPEYLSRWDALDPLFVRVA